MKEQYYPPNKKRKLKDPMHYLILQSGLATKAQQKRMGNSLSDLNGLFDVIERYDSRSEDTDYEASNNAMKEFREKLAELNKAFHEFNAYNNIHKTIDDAIRLKKKVSATDCTQD